MSTCVFYVDESGSPSKHRIPIPNGCTPIFTLTAIGLPLAEWRNFSREYLNLKRQYFRAELSRSHIEDAYYEIKGRLLIAPRNSKDRRKHAFLKEVIKLSKRFNCVLFAVSVVKSVSNPTSQTSIYTSSLQYLVERFSIYISESNVYANGIIIADSRMKNLDRQVATSHMSYIWGSDTGREYNNILEAPLFADSELTTGLQIADILSSVVYSNHYNYYCRNLDGAISYSHMNDYWNRINTLEFQSRKKYSGYIIHGFRVIRHDKND